MDMLRKKNTRMLSELEQITYHSQVYALPIEQRFQTGIQGRADCGCAVLCNDFSIVTVLIFP